MAIKFYTIMAADKPVDGKNLITFRSTSQTDVAVVDLSAPVKPSSPKWGNYPRGVVAGFLARGINPGGLDVLPHSTVPLGSGLSSSAALEVATAPCSKRSPATRASKARRYAMRSVSLNSSDNCSPLAILMQAFDAMVFASSRSERQTCLRLPSRMY